MKKQFKQILALILALAMALSLSITAFAAEAAPETDGNALLRASSEEEKSILYSGKAGDNATYTFYANGDLVFSGTGWISRMWRNDIDYYAFPSILNIIIEEGITEVRRCCFFSDDYDGFFDHPSIYIPSTLKKVERAAFDMTTKEDADPIAGEEGKDTVYIADLSAWCLCDFETASSNPGYDADHIIYQGKELTHVDVPAGITELKFTFAGWKCLETVTLPTSVTTLSATFYGSGLHEITLPSSIKYDSPIDGMYNDDYIGGDYYTTFSYCNNLVFADFSASQLTCIPEDEFYQCSNLKTVVASKKIVEIGDSAFFMCASLEGISSLNAVTQIGQNAFMSCKKLKTLYLPSVNRVDRFAFWNCSSLTTLVLGTDVTFPSYSNGNINGFFANCPSTLTIYAPKNYPEFKGFNYKSLTSTITASNFTKTSSTSSQKFNLGVKTLDNAKLTYTTASKKVTIDKSGNVTIPAKYVGKLTIKIKAAATDKFPERTKSITLTVNPNKTTLYSVSNIRTRKVKVKWKRNTIGSGYQVQCSTDKTFKKGVSSKTISGNSTVSTTFSKRTKGKTYYVRIRTYKTVSGVKYYSSWSSVKSVKISK